jgi:hypothetical protein
MLRRATVPGSPFAGASTVFYAEFQADGSLKPAATPYTQIAVASATVVNNLPAFNNAGACAAC